MSYYLSEHLVHERIAESRRIAASATPRRSSRTPIARRFLTAMRRNRRSQEATTPAECRTGDLAVDLATLGFDAVEHELAEFLRSARDRGVSPDVLTLIADRNAPMVVRQRAFARACRSVDRQPSSARLAA